MDPRSGWCAWGPEVDAAGYRAEPWTQGKPWGWGEESTGLRRRAREGWVAWGDDHLTTSGSDLRVGARTQYWQVSSITSPQEH